MDVDLATPYAGGRDPAAVLGKHTGDLVDVHLTQLPFTPEPVDLNRDRKCLFRDDNRIKIRVECRAEPVAERFDLPMHRILVLLGFYGNTVGNEFFKVSFAFGKRTGRVRLFAGKSVRRKPDHNLSLGPGERKRPGQESLVAVVKGVKRAPYHNLHTLCTLSSYGIMGMDGKIAGTPLFAAPNATVTGRVTLGKDVGIWFGAVIRADKDRIVIGDRSNIQDNCIIHTSAGFPTMLGSDVSVGHGAILHGCTIGDRVLVGMGAIVLNGAHVGEDSLIGAGAVVTEGMLVPAGSVVLGVPGRVLKETTPAQRAHIMSNAQSYVRLAGEYAHG